MSIGVSGATQAEVLFLLLRTFPPLPDVAAAAQAKITGTVETARKEFEAGELHRRHTALEQQLQQTTAELPQATAWLADLDTAITAGLLASRDTTKEEAGLAAAEARIAALDGRRKRLEAMLKDVRSQAGSDWQAARKRSLHGLLRASTAEMAAATPALLDALAKFSRASLGKLALAATIEFQLSAGQS